MPPRADSVRQKPDGELRPVVSLPGAPELPFPPQPPGDIKSGVLGLLDGIFGNSNPISGAIQDAASSSPSPATEFGTLSFASQSQLETVMRC